VETTGHTLVDVQALETVGETAGDSLAAVQDSLEGKADGTLAVVRQPMGERADDTLAAVQDQQHRHSPAHITL